MIKKLNKISSIVLSIALIFQQTSFAQMAMELNLSGVLARMQNSFHADNFRPVHMRFFSYDGLNNNFKLILDKGDLKNLKGVELDNVSKQLINYFLVGVTLNNDAFWVNLRPDSENEIIDRLLARTDVGKIMLEADLELKKDTASFTSPQTTEGKAYWNKLYKKAEELFGTDQITIPTLTRPWIVPDEVIVRENKDSAYIYKASLKVMLEEDYLKGQQDSSLRGVPQSVTTRQSQADYSFNDPRLKELNKYSTELIKELILPKLTKEINTSKKYAQLRQVFFSLILSRWFKSRFQGKAGDYVSLINKGNLTNLTSKTAWSASTYFKAYQESFNKGEYNVKEPVYTPSGQVIRSYFSGGEDLTGKALKFDGASSPLGFGMLPGKRDITANLVSNPNMVTVGSSPIDIKAQMARELEHPANADRSSPDELNARKFEELDDEGVVAAPFSWLEDVIPDDFNLAPYVKEVISGQVAYFKFAAGEASRLWKSFVKAGIISEKDKNNPQVKAKFKMWNLDLWDVADKVRNNLGSLAAYKFEMESELTAIKQKQFSSEKLSPDEEKQLKEYPAEIEDLNAIINGFNNPHIPGLDKANPAAAWHTKLGIRHIIALKVGIMHSAEGIGEDPTTALNNVRLVLAVTNALVDTVLSDLELLHQQGQLGFRPENIYLVINDNIPGYKKDDINLTKVSKVYNAKGELLDNPNPNHGFNIIYANNPSKDGIWRYSSKQDDFVNTKESVFRTLRKQGVKTVAVHRTNDMIMLSPELAFDIKFYALYRVLQQKFGINHLIEVLNNFTGEKGGLAFSTIERAKHMLMMLAEGLAVKTAKAKEMLNFIRSQVKEQGLKDIPYNRMYHLFDIEAMCNSLDANGGLLPMSFKDDKPTKGIWSPEIPTGDTTMLKGIRTAATIRRNDNLINQGILPADDNYSFDAETQAGTGALIHDFKQLKHLLVALGPAYAMDQQRQRNPQIFPASSPVGEKTSFSIIDMSNAFQRFRGMLNRMPVALGQGRMRSGQNLAPGASTEAIEAVLNSFKYILEGVDALIDAAEINRALDLLRNYKEQLKGDLDPTSPMYKYLWIIRDADDAVEKAIKKLEEKSAASRGGASSALLDNDSTKERVEIWQPEEIDAAIAQAEKTNVTGANTNDDYRAIARLADITGMDKKQFQHVENLLTHLLEGKDVQGLLRKIAGKSLAMVRSNHSQFGPAQPVEQKGAVIGFFRENEDPENIARTIEIFGTILKEVGSLSKDKFMKSLAIDMLGSLGGMNKQQFFSVVNYIYSYLIRTNGYYFALTEENLRSLFVWYYPVTSKENEKLFGNLEEILNSIATVEAPTKDEIDAKKFSLVFASLNKIFRSYQENGEFSFLGESEALVPLTSPYIYRNLAKDAVTYYVRRLSRSIKLSDAQKGQKVNIVELQALVDKAVERLATFVHGEFINGKIPSKNNKDGGINYREQILAFMSAADEIVNKPNYWWVKNSIEQAAYHMRLIEEAQAAAGSPVEDNEALKLLSGYIRDFKVSFNRYMREISQSVIGTTSSSGSVGLVMNGSIIDGSLGTMRTSVDELDKLELKNVPEDRIITYLTTLGALKKEVESAAKNDSVRRNDYHGVQTLVSEFIDKLTDIQKVPSGPQAGSSSPINSDQDNVKRAIGNGDKAWLETLAGSSDPEAARMAQNALSDMRNRQNQDPRGDGRYWSGRRDTPYFDRVNAIDAYWKERDSWDKGRGSSPINSDQVEKTGGIDFRDRAMQIKYEALGSFSKLDFTKFGSSPILAKMNLDAEWKQISTAVGNGYVISGQRIEEFILACSQKGELDTRADELLCFLADYCRLLEKECYSTPKEVMESMVIVESRLQG